MDKLCFVFVFCILTCCTSPQNNKNAQASFSVEIPVIDVEKAVASAKDIYKLSDMAERIEYIPLEFTSECDCAIGNRIWQVYITTEDIFILSGVVYRFGINGKFKNVIGKVGRGPGEFPNTNSFTVDTIKRHVYVNANGMMEIVVYDYDGHHVQTVKKDYNYSTEFYYFPENNILAHIGIPIEVSLPNSFFISVTDINNNRILHKKYLLSSLLLSSNHGVNGGHYSSLQRHNRLLLTESMNDTIFAYSNGILSPFLILNLGKYKSKIKDEIAFAHGDEGALYRYMDAPNIVEETDHFLFLYFTQGNGNKYLLKYDKYSREYTTFKVKKREEKSPAEIIYNDIDGGLPIIWRAVPKYNQLARIVHTYDMKEMLTSEYFSKSEAKDQQAKERLKNLVQSLGDEDNPVIMKVILK